MMHKQGHKRWWENYYNMAPTPGKYDQLDN